MTKVKIYTIADKRPDFIPWQKRSFDKFLAEEYSFFVVDNASEMINSEKIKESCSDLHINCIELPKQHHENANIACSFPIDWLIKNVIASDEDVSVSILIDSDMFLIGDFDPSKIVNGYWIAGLPQRRGHVKYIWNGILLINHNEVKNIEDMSFCCSGCYGYCDYLDENKWHKGKIEGQFVDVGGGMFYYFKQNPDSKLKELWSTHHISNERKNVDNLPYELIDSYQDDFCFEIIEQRILHYGSGSNWKNQPSDYHQRKTEYLHSVLSRVFTNEIQFSQATVNKKYIDPEYKITQYLDSILYFIFRT